LDKVEHGDELYLGLSDEDAEMLCEQLITTIADRYKAKLQRYNEYKKLYWMNELDGNEDEWDNCNWNAFKIED
jgi:hypothetical protein